MKAFNLIICITLALLLVWLNRMFVPADAVTLGGLSWYGWASIALVIAFAAFVAVLNDSARAFGFFSADGLATAKPSAVRRLDPAELGELGLEKYRGPEFPHPVIFPDRCIGCHACVDACPHDVLAIVDGRAEAVAPDLCMEDTACQAECPVSPKACIVVNTTKPIVSRPSPIRDGATYETNVKGCYIIGDVSGVPLIKNAVREGAEVIGQIADDLRNDRSSYQAEHDVAIIGVGPGGASAAASARAAGLRYVAIEQERRLASIENYPIGKYIFFKPDTKNWEGGLPDMGPGDLRERILDNWNASLDRSGVLINEFESCKSVGRAGTGDHFVIKTEQVADKSEHIYRARRVVLSVGLRGAPNRLRLPNEDMMIGPAVSPEPKVLYSLNDPGRYKGRKIIVVGGGNSAVEAAVDLVAKRDGASLTPRPPSEINDVTLLVRTYLAPTVKFGNKVQLYKCVDAGTIDLRFGQGIKELRPGEVVLEDVRTKKSIETVSNDIVFALIGGERPDKFLQSIGIEIG